MKYTEDSSFYTFSNMNFIYNAQVTRMLFGCISEASILYMCNIMYFSAKEKKIRKARKAAIVIARLIVSFSIILILILIKIIVNSTGIIYITNSSSKHYSGDINTTARNVFDRLVYRSNVNGEDSLFYEKTNVEITQKSNIVFSFALNNFLEIITNYEDNVLHRGFGKSVVISDKEVLFYSNQYIVFVENEVPQIISFEDVCSTNQNDILTAFLEKMVSNGYWDFFEFGCDYLLKYDPDFITPYISRYANGEFTENEKNINADIRQEYMVAFSRKRAT